MRQVCVFAGSRAGTSLQYEAAARGLATAMLSKGLGLVYGGGAVGLMGVLADQMLSGGGQVIGVIPRPLVQREVAHPDLTELRIVPSMHERKAQMAHLADAFIALPGALGTLEELFEIWTWAQLGIHRKPCGILNVAGYYDSLLRFLDHSVSEGFLQPKYRGMLLLGETGEDLVAQLEAYRSPEVAQWMEEGET